MREQGRQGKTQTHVQCQRHMRQTAPAHPDHGQALLLTSLSLPLLLSLSVEQPLGSPEAPRPSLLSIDLSSAAGLLSIAWYSSNTLR